MSVPVILYYLLLISTDFPKRNGELHRKYATEWFMLDDDDRQDWFDEHGARYFGLSRLFYFDPVRMTVIDPMHNILLG